MLIFDAFYKSHVFYFATCPRNVNDSGEFL